MSVVGVFDDGMPPPDALEECLYRGNAQTAEYDGAIVSDARRLKSPAGAPGRAKSPLATATGIRRLAKQSDGHHYIGKAYWAWSVRHKYRARSASASHRALHILIAQLAGNTEGYLQTPLWAFSSSPLKAHDFQALAELPLKSVHTSDGSSGTQRPSMLLARECMGQRLLVLSSLISQPHRAKPSFVTSLLKDAKRRRLALIVN